MPAAPVCRAAPRAEQRQVTPGQGAGSSATCGLSRRTPCIAWRKGTRASGVTMSAEPSSSQRPRASRLCGAKLHSAARTRAEGLRNGRDSPGSATFSEPAPLELVGCTELTPTGKMCSQRHLKSLRAGGE